MKFPATLKSATGYEKHDNQFHQAALLLHSLTVTALMLPGLFDTPANANKDEMDFQYSHYQEDRHNLLSSVSQFNPIEAESLHGSGKITLTNRIKFVLNTQDI